MIQQTIWSWTLSLSDCTAPRALGFTRHAIWANLYATMTVWWFEPLWKIGVHQLGWLFPTEWKNNPVMFQSPPTRKYTFHRMSDYIICIYMSILWSLSSVKLHHFHPYIHQVNIVQVWDFSMAQSHGLNVTFRHEQLSELKVHRLDLDFWCSAGLVDFWSLANHLKEKKWKSDIPTIYSYK